MYTCGITPYDATHLGHAATFISYDVLQRRLIDAGHTVKCVRNVTDVDDPLFAKARELGVHYLDLAAGEEARFERDLRRPERAPGRVGAACLLGDPRHPRLHRHGARSRLRVRGGRRRVLRRVEVRAVRIAEQLHRGRDDRPREATRRSGRRPQQAPSARLRAVAAVGAPTSRRGTRCGGPVAPDGTSSAAPWPCASSARRSISTAEAPT